MSLSALTTTSQLSTQMQTYYDRLFLSVLEAKLRFERFAYKRNIPVNSGKIIQFNRYKNFSPATTALTEGIIPSQDVLSGEAVSATVAGYGNWIARSDLVSMTAIDPNLRQSVQRMSYNAAQTIDILYRDRIFVSGSIQYASTDQWLSAITNSDKLTSDLVADRVRALRSSDVMPVMNDDYVLIIHPNQAYDLLSDTSAGGWQDITKYERVGPWLEGEIGRVFGARVFESTNIKTISSGMSASVSAGHYGVIFGDQAYAGVGLGAPGNLRVIVKALGSGGTADPLDQIATVGWKAYLAPQVLDSNRVYNIVTGRSGVETPN